ncbi:MAG: MoaD/ThiS family protein [Thermoplasmatales archaeon]|nr:MoaD/ThiS family protein [Thermoplasmatales archaeon]
MKITVKFFAGHREAVGKEKIEMNVKKDATVNDVLNSLIKRYPNLEELKEYTIVSRNHKYAKLNEKLKERDELAFFPPVGGG